MSGPLYGPSKPRYDEAAILAATERAFEQTYRQALDHYYMPIPARPPGDASAVGALCVVFSCRAYWGDRRSAADVTSAFLAEGCEGCEEEWSYYASKNDDARERARTIFRRKG